MATSTVAADTDWIEAFVFGSPSDRWRLDDYDIWAHVKAPNDNTVLLDLTLDNGRLIIVDALARRLEINVGWADIEALDASPGAAKSYVYDFYLRNRTTDVAERSGPHQLTITPGITQSEAL